MEETAAGSVKIDFEVLLSESPIVKSVGIFCLFVCLVVVLNFPQSTRSFLI